MSQVSLGYIQHWMAILSADSKAEKIGRAVVRSVCKLLWKSNCNSYILRKVGIVVRSELISMCSEKNASVVCDTSPSTLYSS